MKVALFHYNGNAEGWEKWSFIKDIETENPTQTATEEFKNKFNSLPDEVKYLNLRVQITDVIFSGMYTAIKKGNNFQEVVIAVRLTNGNGTK